MKPIKEGKVREIYDNGDSLIMVATDRISCFDVILKNIVSKKGTVLTQMSKFWFDLTKDILPNHMISTDVKDMPEFFQKPEYDGNSMMCKKLEMLPIECIVRGYITGSGWASYKENGTVCGIKLPEGLKESDKLPEPIYTPSTKAEIGDHDENISFEQSIDHLEKYFPGKGREYAEKLRDNTIALYKKCAEYALSKGIIIADTKFEFGLDEDGNMVIGDEMLTPDSSRFWPAEGYEPGHGQPSFDKQFARDWLKANPMTGHFRRKSWTRPSRNISRHTKCLQEKNWPENNSSSEIEHTLQTAPDAHSEAVSFYIKCDKNKTVARKQRGIYNKYRNQMILTDLKECDYEQEKQGEKEKNSWRSYSDDRSDRGNLYFLLCSF